jgi:hypothetical protein
MFSVRSLMVFAVLGSAQALHLNRARDAKIVPHEVNFREKVQTDMESARAFLFSDSLILELDEPLNLKHNAKTGGTFVKGVLEHLMGSEQTRTYNEFTPQAGVGPMPQTSSFKLGMIREPCSTYVSLWSVCTQGLRSQKAGGRRFGDPICYDPAVEATVDKASLDDKESLKKFVKTLVSQDDKIGLLTCRNHYNYVNRSQSLATRQNAACSNMDQLRSASGEGMLGNFAANDASASSDCWLHQESLETDLHTCLQQYEKKTGRSANLHKYDEAVSLMKSSHPNSVEEHLKKEMGNVQGEFVHECNYYFDKETQEHVEKHDQAVYKAFGYKGCCAK